MTPRRKTTLSDVAKRAGVSLGAASKVLNGGCGKIGVGADTRKRILEAAENLNYKANMAASILAGGHSRLIGVFIDSFTPHRGLRLLQEIERCSVRQGYRIITCFSHDDIAGMKSDYQTLRRYGITDFICCSHDYPRMKDEIRELFSDVENVVFMEKPCLEDRPFVRTSRRKALTDILSRLATYCDEFLIHAVDVEGKNSGIERDLAEMLGRYEGIPVTYAGGVHSYEDVRLLGELGRGRLNVTVGSALDLFGGKLSWKKILRECRKQQEGNQWEKSNENERPTT